MDMSTSNFFTNQTSSASPRPTSVFNGTESYKPIEWNQVTPQPLPWAQHPNFYSSVMKFGSPQFYQPPSTMSTTTQTTVFQNAFMPTPTSTSLSSVSQTISSPGVFTSSPSFMSVKLHCKRKSDANALTPVKQHITEERMAAHMSKLHISSETPITSATTSTTSGDPLPIEEAPAEREKRLIMCEEMRRLQTESIIPSALMRRDLKSPLHGTPDNPSIVSSSRLERPCMAVMLWQPPQRTSEGIFLPSMNATSIITTMVDNNNDSAVNLNTTPVSASVNGGRGNATTNDDDDDSAEMIDMDMDL